MDKIVFFEIEKWEEDYIGKTLSGGNFFFSNEKLTLENAANFKDANIISTFIYSTINKELLDILPNLKFIATRSMGFDHIDVAACKAKGIVVTQIRYYGIDDKLKFLIHKFAPKYVIGKSKAWTCFIEFKALRDSLVHPRQIEDEIDIDAYREKLRKGMFGTITLMNDISKGVFKRPFRKKILDLIPE